MEWQELRQGVYRVDGSLRDLYVMPATRADWQTWMAYVNGHYPVRWVAENYQDGTPSARIDAAFIDQRWEGEQDVTAATIWLEQVRVQCYFFIAAEIENDLDPRELHSWADHQRVLDYAVGLSTVLGKEVIITEENSPEHVWIRVNGARIQYEQPDFNA